MKLKSAVFLLLSALVIPALAQTRPSLPPGLPVPTAADVAYGRHPKMLLDFWKAPSAKPTPLVFHIHGGAWKGGERIFGLVRGGGFIQKCLDQGISVVSVEYRFIPEATADGEMPPVRGPMLDSARALQFCRSQALAWNLDKTRIGACGDSAGGCTALWLAFHKDLADPASADPVARESTRLSCVALQHPQTTLDPLEIQAWIPNCTYGGHAFGIAADPTRKITEFQNFLASREKLLPWIQEYSPYAQLTSEAPPVLMSYYTKPTVGQAHKDGAHSSNFGWKLQEKCRTLGVECHLLYPESPDLAALPAKNFGIVDFLIRKLTASK